MFTSAIETAAIFTKPIHVISRHWGSHNVTPGTATLFFVNGDGWALTCKHVANLIPAAKDLAAKFTSFKAEKNAIPAGKKYRESLRAVERKYEVSSAALAELQVKFINCIEGPIDLEIRFHPALDLALIKFNNFTRLLATGFPTFARSGVDLKSGKSLCRWGFPFPEFTNYEYSEAADEIRWTNAGRIDSPSFPIDGMVTRHLGGANGIIGFEMSTPGLKGQSGGPAFDVNGHVWGMQNATNHLDLDFDVDVEVLRNGRKKRVTDSAFLHVGHCVHLDVLKQFMRDNRVAFSEAA